MSPREPRTSMKIRRASRALVQVTANPALASGAPLKKASPPEPAHSALEWRGAARIAAERALGTPVVAARRSVRTGLLERLIAIGSDHRDGPHAGRPEAANRLLAHVDGLAEVGFSFDDLVDFASTLELGSPGVLWTLVVLFGALDAPRAEEALEAWIGSLDEATLTRYAAVIEIADALRTQPNGLLRAAAARWMDRHSPVLRAVRVEMAAPGELGEPALGKAAADRAPLPFAAFERYLARTPDIAYPGGRASWMDVDSCSLAYEVAAARVLRGDPEPLHRLRDREPRAIAALGSSAMDLLALAGEGADDGLAREIALRLPTTPELIDAMGRAGMPGLFSRLLAEVSGEDFDDEARAALTTALGPRAPEGAAAKVAASWEAALVSLPGVVRVEGGLFAALPASRFRGGQAWSTGAVIAEMARPELSASDLRSRAAEIWLRSGRPPTVDWDAFGVSLAPAIPRVAALVR